MKYFIYSLIVSIIFINFNSCKKEPEFINTKDINSISRSYVKLCFALGKFDKDYVDSYYGPEGIKTESIKDSVSIKNIVLYSDLLINALKESKFGNSLNGDSNRIKYLSAMLKSLKTRALIISGEKYRFDKESKELYDAVLPTYSINYYKEILHKLDSILPGKGDLQKRYQTFSQRFIIPKNKIDTVLRLAIAECRKRTKEHLQLPENEKFTMEIVKNQPWLAYNWYKGDNYSLIQFNTDLPTHIESVLEIAAHEGYPGHHTNHSLIEQRYYKEKGWVEYSILPLFSPRSIIEEGIASYAVNMIFTPDEKLKFGKDIICMVAGLNPADARIYFEILELKRKLRFAGNEIARRYLDGKMNKEIALNWLQTYELRTKDEAMQSLRFFERYRSYVITYTLGQELINGYIEKNVGSFHNPDKKWQLFNFIVSNPVLPQDFRNN